MAERIVGLSIDGGRLRAVEVEMATRGDEQHSTIGSMPVPDGAMADGRVIDRPALARALREMWSEAGFRSRKVRLAIDGRVALLRRTELPDRSEDSLREAAGYDIGELLTYPIEEAVFDVAALDTFERDGDAWISALVVSVEAAVLDEFRGVLDDAGLTLLDVEFAADAIGSAVRTHEDLGNDELSVIVDVEDTVTSIAIRDGGGTVFARGMSAGVGASALTVAEELESELAALAGTDDSTGGTQHTAPGVSTVVEGVRRTLDYFRAEIDSRPLRGITLTGSRSPAAGLLTALESATQLTVSTSEPTIDWSVESEPFQGYELALGAALIGRRQFQPARRLRLVSDAARRARTRRRQVVLTAVVTLLVAGICAIDGFARRAEADVLQGAADDAEATSDVLLFRVDELDDVRTAQAMIETGEAQMASLRAQALRYVDVLQEAAELMPEESQLVSVQLRRSDAEGLPTGYVGPPVEAVATFAGLAEDLDVVGRWIEAVEAATFLDALWLDQSVHGPLGDTEEEGSIFVVEAVVSDAARVVAEEDGG